MPLVHKLNKPLIVQVPLPKSHVITATVAGFGLGLLYNLLIPVFSVEASIAFRAAIPLWYGTLGGCAGLLHHHLDDHWRDPGSHKPGSHKPDWLTAGIFCAWCNALLLLFTLEQMTSISSLAFNTSIHSAWFIAEGFLSGTVISISAKMISVQSGIS